MRWMILMVAMTGTAAWADQAVSAQDLVTGEAEFALGRAYFHGEGQPKDEQKAAEHFRKAAELGNAKAQHNLGLMYAEGRGVTADEFAAVEWLSKAGAQGILRSQLQVGEFYFFGSDTIPKNSGEAKKWLALAADQRDPQAQYLLGMLYEEGEGVDRNPAEAARLHRLAAEQGHHRAQAQLGKLYAAGNGVELDRVEAYYWLKRSAAQDNPEALTFLLPFIALLTPDQIEGGERLLRERPVPGDKSTR